MAGRGRSQVALATAAVLIPGIAAFILGVFAENVKPNTQNIVPTQFDGLSFCAYPRDSSPLLAILAVALLFLSFLVALASLLFPYNGRVVPLHALSRSTGLLVFVLLSLAVFLTAEGLLLWAAISHRPRKHTPHLGTCPSPGINGLMGGGAFLALDATLFWLVSLMLALNARDDYLLGLDEKGSYGALDVRYSTASAPPPSTISSVPAADVHTVEVAMDILGKAWTMHPGTEETSSELCWSPDSGVIVSRGEL